MDYRANRMREPAGRKWDVFYFCSTIRSEVVMSMRKQQKKQRDFHCVHYQHLKMCWPSYDTNINTLREIVRIIIMFGIICIGSLRESNSSHNSAKSLLPLCLWTQHIIYFDK